MENVYRAVYAKCHLTYTYIKEINYKVPEGCREDNPGLLRTGLAFCEAIAKTVTHSSYMWMWDALGDKDGAGWCGIWRLNETENAFRRRAKQVPNSAEYRKVLVEFNSLHICWEHLIC